MHGLEKRYGDIKAVDGIDFTVAPGETFGFLGPNGAGKSTTISILCTLTDPTAGAARVAGHDVVTERGAVRRNIGLVFQDTTLDLYLTAEQNLRFHAELYGVPKDLVDPRMQQVLEMVGLWDRRKARVDTYSGGMKRRLEIARGCCTRRGCCSSTSRRSGLDPQTRRSIWSYINELRSQEDITIFLTTHYMDEAEHCDRIAIMNEGKIVVLDTPDALKASVGKDRVQIETDDDTAAIAELQSRYDIDAKVHDGAVTFAVVDAEQFVPRLFKELHDADPVGEPVAPVARRRVPVVHRHHDQRRRGVDRRPTAGPPDDGEGGTDDDDRRPQVRSTRSRASAFPTPAGTTRSAPSRSCGGAR